MAKKELSFEEALNQLEEIVESLENGSLSLDESIDMFQKGMEMSNFCSKKLDTAEKKISIILKGKDGELEKVPFISEEE